MAKRKPLTAGSLILIPIIRTSTNEQQNGLAAQYQSVERYATAKGHELMSIVAPCHTSGSGENWDNRADIQAALDACRQGIANGIIASRLDRIARSVRHLNQLAYELQAMGCHLIITEQQIDTSTPTGKLMFTMLGAIAEFERDLISQRTKEGLSIVAASGKHIGRPASIDDASVMACFHSCNGNYSVTARKLEMQPTQVRRIVARNQEAV